MSGARAFGAAKFVPGGTAARERPLARKTVGVALQIQEQPLQEMK
jgi:hypothetical protein